MSVTRRLWDGDDHLPCHHSTVAWDGKERQPGERRQAFCLNFSPSSACFMICMRYARDMRRYSQDMPQICQRYAQDMPKIWPPVRRSWQNVFLTKRLSWSWQNVFLTKRLRQVRPDKMSKAVLTKRLPDKTSKAVLTKRLPDKTSILTKRLLTLRQYWNFNTKETNAAAFEVPWIVHLSDMWMWYREGIY